MQSLLPSILPSFHQASILVIGDVMLDRYWFGDTMRISPEAPVPIVKIHECHHRPGGAGNVALNIAGLSANVTLLGITGPDEAGKLLKDQLSAASVQHDLCMVEGLSTIVKLRVISRHQQLIRLDFEETLIHEQEEILLNKYKKYLNQVNLVILSDYQKGSLVNPQAFIKLARDKKIPVLVDPKGHDFHRYKNATIITPNLKEFETIVGKCKDEIDLIAKGKTLLQRYHISHLLVTRGEEGMTLIEADDSAHFPAQAHEVFDVTGAGDTVIAVLGTALAAGIELLSATALANLAASLTVAKLGAASITPPELQIALNHQMNFATGIVNETQLLQAIQHLRAQGKKFVFTNGCFDILHAGHVTYLQKAKELADFLIVAVNTDHSIKELKGSNRPINPLEQRMTVLAELGAVDWVIPFAEQTPHRLLSLLQPDILVKGGDYQHDQIVGREVVEAYGGEIRIINRAIVTSSTDIINRIQEKSAS
jgi:D-beta-D-heptose 7-phosphate kinase/D-beta-D-heptose 1-phosphate adenosyltransferase